MSEALIQALDARGLDVELMVKTGAHGSGRLGPDTLAIPYRDGGVTVATKYRTIGADKRFTQDAGGRQILWNLDCLRDESLKAEPLIITEGELDAIAALQSGYPRTVSVPGGAPMQPGAKRHPYLDEAEPLLADVREIILAVDGDSPGANLLHDLAQRLGKARCKWLKYPKGCKDLNDALREYGARGVQETIRRAAWYPVPGIYRMSDLPPVDETPALDIGMVSLWEHYRVRRGDFVVVTGVPGHGKALDVETPIPTPGGFTRMGDLVVGSAVYAETGQPCRVVATSGVMIGRPCYAVKFDDGSEIVADADHQWLTLSEKARRSALMTARKRGGRQQTKPKGTDQRHKRTFASVVTTREIAASIMSQGKRNHQIALAAPVERAEAPLPIDPWMLGVWLGDGTTTDGVITTADAEIVAGIEAKGWTTSKRSATYSVGVRKLKVALRDAGVLGVKHIPAIYMLSSAEQRWQLLRGLMDTDGTCMKDRTCEFTSVNAPLASAVLDLALGLGLKATMLVGRATLNGRDCGAKYRVRFVSHVPVFTLRRKLARQGVGRRSKIFARVIVSCDPVESRPVACIQVDSPAKLFLAGRQHIATHNSSFINEVCCRLAHKHGWSTVFGSFEQQPQIDHRRALRSFHAGKLARAMTPDETAKADAWIDRHFSFIVPDDDTDADLAWTLERCAVAVRQYGADVVVIDPWNELDHVRPPDMSLTEYTGYAIKQFKRFAKKHRVHLIVAAHPAKMARGKDGKYPVPTLYDISDSAHWYNKPDLGIVIHRDSVTGNESTIRVVKSRYHEAIGRPGEIRGIWNTETTRYTIVEDTA